MMAAHRLHPVQVLLLVHTVLSLLVAFVCNTNQHPDAVGTPIGYNQCHNRLRRTYATSHVSSSQPPSPDRLLPSPQSVIDEHLLVLFGNQAMSPQTESDHAVRQEQAASKPLRNELPLRNARSFGLARCWMRGVREVRPVKAHA